MKKVISVFTLVLFASFVFAQTNVSDIKSTGNDHHAGVAQTGMHNTSKIIQEKEDNVAMVEQINPHLLSGNIVISEIKQTGRRNYADVMQNHDGSTEGNAEGPIEAKIMQSGNDNDAFQVQGPHGQLGNNSALINQSGNSNFATQVQVKYMNDAKILQSGNGNFARQEQDLNLTPDAFGSANSASINQSGKNNFADQYQDGWANTAGIDQSGSNNTATQNQFNYSWKSNAEINQSGNGNYAEQDQVGLLNDAEAKQMANAGYAKQVQLSEGGKRSGTDYTPYNKGVIIQKGGSDNGAEQWQEANTTDFDMNYAKTLQDGSNNWALQDQTGGFNTSNVSQVGSGNSANVVQTYPAP